MSVLGIGIDLVSQERIAGALRRHGDRFRQRICSREEVAGRDASPLEQLAGTFAAKEAVLKALGTGWAEGLAFRQIAILRDRRGAPTASLRGAARQRADQLGVRSILISITHDGGMAAAVAVLTGDASGGEAP